MRGMEVYWRGGYTIEGAAPAEVIEHGRSENEAQTQVQVEAAAVRAQLTSLGLSNTVEMWVERWTITNTVKTHPRMVFGKVGVGHE
ncbi:hypothetical protein [Cryobacterium cryoconiti]|uniref:Uncharacterized protein n=1 Tax=Cryobacterium cryoconiti TaxID=1259239 RepID=A0A4Y8JSR0_9MICO|nr:hypothetical protein [Cryobacterium cryoconiti]TFD27503.1 hypothetical protein E3T49_13255 [Cryobacterium cryoconiti]